MESTGTHRKTSFTLARLTGVALSYEVQGYGGKHAYPCHVCVKYDRTRRMMTRSPSDSKNYEKKVAMKAPSRT